MKKIIGWAIAIVTLAGIGAVVGFNMWQQSRMLRLDTPSKTSVRIDVPRQTVPPVETATHYPLPHSAEVQAARDPLPLLQESDRALVIALSGLLSRKTVMAFFYPEKIVRHIVVTIDNLPRQSLAVQLLPVKPVGGKFLTKEKDKNLFIAPENAARYTSYVRLMEMMDAKKLVALYVHFYPLFQQAYQELGYPDGDFNDRLIAVIDHLLAVPDNREPILVVQPHVFYQFADQELESASAGRKILMRIDAENSAQIKTKLREIRHQLTETDLK